MFYDFNYLFEAIPYKTIVESSIPVDTLIRQNNFWSKYGSDIYRIRKKWAV